MANHRGLFRWQPSQARAGGSNPRSIDPLAALAALAPYRQPSLLAALPYAIGGPTGDDLPPNRPKVPPNG